MEIPVGRWRRAEKSEPPPSLLYCEGNTWLRSLWAGIFWHFGLSERGLARGSARLSLRENRLPSEVSYGGRNPTPRFEQELGL